MSRGRPQYVAWGDVPMGAEVRLPNGRVYVVAMLSFPNEREVDVMVADATAAFPAQRLDGDSPVELISHPAVAAFTPWAEIEQVGKSVDLLPGVVAAMSQVADQVVRIKIEIKEN